DKDHRALQTMKSFTGVQPGETRACFGCHEQKMNAVGSKAIGLAMRKPPASITPVPWEDITVGYERYVQPTLDKYCGKCHADTSAKPNKATQTFNSRLRPGHLGFKEPYLTLTGNPTWFRPYEGVPAFTNTKGGFGWADTIIVEGYNGNDTAAYRTYPAMTRLSYKSRLIKRLAGEKVTPDDKHPLIRVDDNALLRAILWVDAMTPYSGAEEVNRLEDPTFEGTQWLPFRPRVHTAPVVPRPGPFDQFHAEEDPAYLPGTLKKHNALPNGVTRK
ncbi:MAG: hypothetical protein LBG65_07645, partial [Puniceicoccales bacterium]|nr:hypothetical protein [Puniceicoccales bacterium]